MWDANADANTILDEYCRLFYGPGEAEMRGFWPARPRFSAEGWCVGLVSQTAQASNRVDGV